MNQGRFLFCHAYKACIYHIDFIDFIGQIPVGQILDHLIHIGDVDISVNGYMAGGYLVISFPEVIPPLLPDKGE